MNWIPIWNCSSCRMNLRNLSLRGAAFCDEAIPKLHERWGLRRKLRLHCQKTARNDNHNRFQI